MCIYITVFIAALKLDPFQPTTSTRVNWCSGDAPVLICPVPFLLPSRNLIIKYNDGRSLGGTIKNNVSAYKLATNERQLNVTRKL